MCHISNRVLAVLTSQEIASILIFLSQYPKLSIQTVILTNLSGKFTVAFNVWAAAFPQSDWPTDILALLEICKKLSRLQQPLVATTPHPTLRSVRLDAGRILVEQ